MYRKKQESTTMHRFLGIPPSVEKRAREDVSESDMRKIERERERDGVTASAIASERGRNQSSWKDCTQIR